MLRQSAAHSFRTTFEGAAAVAVETAVEETPAPIGETELPSTCLNIVNQDPRLSVDVMVVVVTVIDVLVATSVSVEVTVTANVDT